MEHVPRHRFVPPDELAYAFADGPLPIGNGQTISQPYIVALMTNLLCLKPEARVLEVGTGSGYQAAVLGEMVKDVHTVEVIPELYENARKILSELGYQNIQLHLADGSLGWPEGGPYDGILVAASAPEVPPPLLEQLTDGGRLVLPVGSRGFQQLEIWEREGKNFECRKNIAVAFVPLRGKYGWK
jgi:protein-L-isoaspartate(D-aspartate) O-methyltransferase